ncbi:uncharacterized protein LOC131285316 [Anopheles ziemanni]|uniref:uncharacterized protein LOC131265709 n=1 Tax=Anopheles coustani TaxID=139045 RepID=UPI00265A87E3|nr:uncharacterized protein LOC131265709 [Anopheles coustani]XP_058170153.1 uncharacterized protein LOC131285316 [Anopheles ziemanni]
MNNTNSRDGSATRVRARARRLLLPVLVYIHGGSHDVGYGDVHGVDLLMENDVIVVTINYRLGVFGFLKDEKNNITGNYGLKDQLVALEWIKRYVSYFGGDPNRVTVMGHSSGAGDLSHHLYNDRARGLFQGAILLSGSMLSPSALLYKGEECMDNYVQDLNASTVEELREKSFEDFFLVKNRYRHAYAFIGMFHPCLPPTLEDHPDDEASYFRQSPHKLVRTKAPHPMPVLISETSTEFELMLKHVSAPVMSKNFPNNQRLEQLIPMLEIFQYISMWVVLVGLEDSQSQFYRKMASMANLHYPIKQLLSEYSQRVDSEQVYYLRFQFDGKFGECKKKIFADYVDNSVYGAIHGDELGYIFSPYNLKKALENRSEFHRELSVHNKTVELITNFVKYENPTPTRKELSDIVWPSYNESRNQTQYLNIDEEFKLAFVTADHIGTNSAECTVQLGPQSTAQGVPNITFNGVQFCEYLGIRYAKPPVGLLRFADPVLEEPDGDNNYTAYGNKCPQFEDVNKHTAVIGAEDCLVLNIFTTVNNSTNRNGSDQLVMLPVLVFIHGGSHVIGSGQVHGVDLLMENEVIVVTIDYRLGVFGFLKDEKNNITGNYGLKDQLVALQWIQRYVSYFGGDPNRVTVMGHSSGAGDLSHHLYNDRARGLFQGAILLSGSMLAPWALLYEGEECMDDYVQDLNASTLDVLREKSFEEFFLVKNRFRYTFAFIGLFHPCLPPTLEDHPDDEASYFRQSPHKLVRTKAPHPMPILIGETSTEFELMLKHVSTLVMSKNFPNNRRLEQLTPVLEIFKYISMWVVLVGLEDSKGHFYRKMASMANAYYPIKQLLSEYSQRVDSEQVYYLRFQFDGKFGECKKKIFADYVDNSVYGAIHGDDMSYIFSPYNLKEALENRSEFHRELSVHNKTVELITNFVKYGNPTPKRSELSDLVWPSYNESRNQTQYLNIDEEFQVRDVEDRQNIYFMIWQIIYECLYYEQCEAVTKLRQLSRDTLWTAQSTGNNTDLNT